MLSEISKFGLSRALMVLFTALSACGIANCAELDDFQGASGIEPASFSSFITVLTEAVLAAGLCWVLVSVIRSWMSSEKNMPTVLWVVFRCFIIVVGVSGMLTFF